MLETIAMWIILGVGVYQIFYIICTKVFNLSVSYGFVYRGAHHGNKAASIFIFSLDHSQFDCIAIQHILSKSEKRNGKQIRSLIKRHNS